MPLSEKIETLIDDLSAEPTNETLDDAKDILASIVDAHDHDAITNEGEDSGVETVRAQQAEVETVRSGSASPLRGFAALISQQVAALQATVKNLDTQNVASDFVDDLIAALSDRQLALLLGACVDDRLTKSAQSKFKLNRPQVQNELRKIEVLIEEVAQSWRELKAEKDASESSQNSVETAAKLDTASEVWHPEERMTDVLATEGDQETDLGTLTTALSRLSESELSSVFEGLTHERLRLVLRVAINLPKVAEELEAENPGLGNTVRQILVEGSGSLTRDEVRKLRTFAVNLLNEDNFDEQIKERAVAKDIFPPARRLFPNKIKMPSDISANTLTMLFREKADDPKANVEALSAELLAAIKDLSQAWRKHFSSVELDGQATSVTSGGTRGLRYRTADKRQKLISSGNNWVKLTFCE
jgi:hypothetical protein